MNLRNRAITALFLSIILIGLAVLIWAQKTGKITIWGTGETITTQEVGWNVKKCPGTSVATGWEWGGAGISGIYQPHTGSLKLKCTNIIVNGAQTVKTQSTQPTLAQVQTGQTGSMLKGLTLKASCPLGTFMDEFIPANAATYPSTTNFNINDYSAATPARINCVALTAQNGALVTTTSNTEVNFSQGTQSLSSQYPGQYFPGIYSLCSANNVIIGFRTGIAAWTPDSLTSQDTDVQSAYPHIFCGALTTTGGTTPTPTPTPTADTTPPSAPLNLTATALSQTEIQLKWTASTDNVGVKGYKLYNADTNELITTTTATSYKVTGAKCGTIYRYFVVAYDAAGNHSNRSNVAEATTFQCDPSTDKDKPTAPGNLKYSNLNSSGTAPDCWSVDLSWTASTDNIGVTGYDIYNAVTNTVITSTDKTNYSLSGLKENSNFSYYVKARDAAGNNSDASNSVDIKTGVCPAKAATVSAASLVSTGGVLWFNILIALVIAGIATYFLLKKPEAKNK